MLWTVSTGLGCLDSCHMGNFGESIEGHFISTSIKPLRASIIHFNQSRRRNYFWDYWKPQRTSRRTLTSTYNHTRARITWSLLALHCSTFIELIMRVVYGIEVNDLNRDHYIELTVDALATSSHPGAFLVDSIPICKTLGFIFDP